MKSLANKTFFFSLAVLVLTCLSSSMYANASDDDVFVVDAFNKYQVKNIAVLPMDNLSLEPDTEQIFYDAIYNYLVSKGYVRVERNFVASRLKGLGVQTPGQLMGFPSKTLGQLLRADALFMGQIDQAASIHTGLYDATVVSCSLRLVHAESGKTIWQMQQKRAAHRQWQLDPVNALINLVRHENDNRPKRIAWIVQEMLKSIPTGPVLISEDNFLEKALELK
jgi:hypothetical protein